MRLDVLAWCERHGLSVVAAEGQRSPTVTAIRLPAGVTGPKMAAEVAKHGYVVGSGYGGLKETTFRIGHMGDHTLEGVRGCLQACGVALKSLRGD
jgi:aspartate aminotransferase-like enzyme